ncbi:hypothetical protein JG688_00008058 [Phytophthora aleatoria]|uniref:Uncharacterized protein n=1 Tax=Phytophthora aleatoria TaxID=2496075 RepID=A0A8J5IJB6_9STRA|nr:hypothetical protein JG688_00008058 [Phytophthora aleatoria]
MERLMAGASSVQMVLEVQRSCSEGLHVVTVLMSSKRLPFDCVWAHFECWMQSRRLQQRFVLVYCAACSSFGFHGVSGAWFVLANTPNI